MARAVDDENTLSVGWFFNAVPQPNRPFKQDPIPYWYAPIKDDETGRWITSHVMNQDFVAWVGQGATSDRWNENLATSDRGVIMMRRRLLDDIKVVEDGGEPKALVRDEELNRGIPLPIIGRDALKGNGPSGLRLGPGQIIDVGGFPFLSGQPTDIQAAYRKAMTVQE